MALITLQALLLLFGFFSCVMSRQGTGYIQYYPGSLNVILSAPHGGNIAPADIPDRDYGCYINRMCVWSHDCGVKDRERCKVTTVTDAETPELTMELRDELFKLLGKTPPIIINKLKRTKLDVNREKEEAAFNVDKAAAAWEEYHDFMNQAKRAILIRGFLGGIVFDMHVHSQPEEWVMLGYLINSSKLRTGNFSAEQTSIRALVEREVRRGTQNLDGMLQGFGSFGSYLYGQSIESVPSPRHRNQENARYFSGGYITQRHGSKYGEWMYQGSKHGGWIDAIQIETPHRYMYSNRGSYVRALAKAIEKFLCRYY